MRFPLLVLLCLSACSARTPSPAGGEWDTAPSLVHARSAHSVVSAAGALYVLAGSGAGGVPVLEVERFDGREWSVVAHMPGAGLNAPAAAVLGDRIYVIGGFSGVSNVPTDQVLVFETRTGEWTEAARLPAPRGGHAAVVLDGRIHVFGGGNDRSTLADHSLYDPATDRWSDLVPLPFPRGSPAGVVLDGRIYSIGGRSGTSDFGDVDVFDPTVGSWRPLSRIEPVGTAGAVVYRGSIMLFGGESQARRESVATTLRYDAATDSWTRAADMPTPRNYARAVPFGDHIYTVGGNTAGPASHGASGSRTVERFFLRRR